MRGLAVAGIAVVLWLTTPAQAQVVFTGNTFFDYCSAREDSLSAGLCLGYIQGVLESSTSTCIIPRGYLRAAKRCGRSLPSDKPAESTQPGVSSR